MKKSLLVPLLAVLVASYCFAQTQTLPQKIAHLYAPLDKSQTATSLFFDQALPLVAPSRYRGSTPPKTLTFTFKTQHRRTWPQPSPLASRCGFSPLSNLERGRG